jgi:hypothetical protein
LTIDSHGKPMPILCRSRGAAFLFLQEEFDVKSTHDVCRVCLGNPSQACWFHQPSNDVSSKSHTSCACVATRVGLPRHSVANNRRGVSHSPVLYIHKLQSEIWSDVCRTRVLCWLCEEESLEFTNVLAVWKQRCTTTSAKMGVSNV